jgi:uncharacterized membrane protein
MFHNQVFVLDQVHQPSTHADGVIQVDATFLIQIGINDLLQCAVLQAQRQVSMPSINVQKPISIIKASTVYFLNIFVHEHANHS